MSELRSSGFFRPWNNPETVNKTSGIVTVNDTLHNTTCSKQEDDNDSVLSSTISTTSMSSTTMETSEKYNHLTQCTADSTPLNVVCRTRIRHGSESSDDIATSTTPSLEGEDSIRNAVRDTRDKSRAFHLQRPIDSMPSESRAISARDSDEFNGSGISPLEYLSALEFRRSADLASISNGAYSMAIASTDIAGPSSVTNSMIPDLHFALPNFHPGMNSGIHSGVQSGIHSRILPTGFYNRSMEEAVQIVHQQDVVAKQMKKLRPKKYRCEYCEVAFSNNGQLKGHIRIHTGERPFKCDVESCGKSFTRNEELTRHKRIHTGIRPHSCIICGKRFGRKDHLKKHTRTHEVRDPYRVSATLNMFAFGHSFQQAAALPSCVYHI